MFSLLAYIIVRTRIRNENKFIHAGWRWMFKTLVPQREVKILLECIANGIVEENGGADAL
jgi:hypothetical protein